MAADFKSLGGELPIRGGWGYTKEDAVIIDKNDPVVPKGLPFDGHTIEYIFVEKRIYEELIIFQPEEHRCSGIEWQLVQQQLQEIDARTYDVLTFAVTAFPDKDWEELRAEWEGANTAVSDHFNFEAHQQKREARQLRYVTDYWFDITSFFGVPE